ncbi:MAG: hypothetical protein WBM44_18185 [Waterburya sp.]
MYKLLLCHRRVPDLSYRQFHTYCLNQRSRLVLKLKTQLGYTGYSQLHQLPRTNLLYNGILLTRSPLVTGLLASKAPEKISSQTNNRQIQQSERWDVIEQFLYPSQDALVTNLTTQQGSETAQQLLANQEAYVERTTVITAEEFVVVEPPSLSFPRINNMLFLRSPGGMTRETMLNYWSTEHKELVQSKQSALRYRAYDQLHIRSSPDLSAVGKTLGGNLGGKRSLPPEGAIAIFSSQLELKVESCPFSLK